jgi:3'-5' exoribonuclease
MNNDVFELISTSNHLGLEVAEISKVVLYNPKFPIWWGGLTGQHHDFDGGLAQHTREVVDLCFNSIETLGLNKIDKKEIFLSALFHDVGKMFDYEKNPHYGNIYFNETTGEELNDIEPEYIATSHKRTIHHISRSALIWSHAVVNTKYADEYHDKVLHNILAHHGERMYGSPVAPKTQAAWLLHLCDSISARMNDCDRLDLVYDKKEKSR